MKKTLVVLLTILTPAVIGLIVGLITKSEGVGVFTFLGIFLVYIIFIWGRQFYWYLTNKGDYEN